MSDDDLTPKQRAFADEYLIDLNATQAATRAGYSEKTACEQGSRLLSNVKVKSYIEKRIKDREMRTEITQDRVLQELARIAFFDIRKLYTEDGSLKNPADLDDDTAAALAGIDVVEMQGGAQVSAEEGAQHVPMFTKKTKAWDKKGALELAMRHLGMLKDKTEITGANGQPLIAAPVFNVTVQGK